MFYEDVRVVALTGEAKQRERFLAELAHRCKVATLREERNDKPASFTRKVADDLLSIQSPSRYVLTQRADDANEIARELDQLAEREDLDFAVVVGSALASRIASFHEVYEARLQPSLNFEQHFESLATAPEWVTLGALVRAVRAHRDIHKAGAILTFTGVVRGEALALEFDIYEGEAQQRISSIAHDLTAIEGIVDARIYHKSGRVNKGEDIVYIVVAAAHRQEGFKALRDAIERIKKEVPIWKKELTERGDKWVGI
ncbi:MAG: molybdenum cofactor biosynthesis protein MoaE [Halobacteriota archaeon]